MRKNRPLSAMIANISSKSLEAIHGDSATMCFPMPALECKEELGMPPQWQGSQELDAVGGGIAGQNPWRCSSSAINRCAALLRMGKAARNWAADASGLR